MADIAATGAHVRVVSLLSAPDPKLRYVAAELVLELARHCPRAPAPANALPGEASLNVAPGVGKAMIQAGGLIAVWGVCSDPSPMARPVALKALATLLGTSAAMSRSTASSEAVLALMYADVVGRLGREFLDPALASRAAGPWGGAGSGGPASPSAVATSALLALHLLAANPDPDVFGLFLAAAGADDAADVASGGGGGGGGGSGGGPSSTWELILSSVESAAGSGSTVEEGMDPELLEAALLAAGSVCGAPPLPPGGRGSRGADEVTRILPTYQARAGTTDCAAAASFAAARGLAARSVALLTVAATNPDAMSLGGAGVGFPTEGGLLSGSGPDSGGSNGGDGGLSARVGRAGIRIVWALSRGSSSATLAAHGTLPRLMDLMSARRRKGGSGVRDDAAAGVLVLETIAAFLTPRDAGGVDGSGGGGGGGVTAAVSPRRGNTERQSASPVSAETAETIGRTIEELWDLALDDNPAHSLEGGDGETEVATVADSLIPRSLSLLAGVAGNPRLRRLLVDSTRFHDVLNLLVVDRRSDGASSSVSAVHIHIYEGEDYCFCLLRGLFLILLICCCFRFLLLHRQQQ